MLKPIFGTIPDLSNQPLGCKYASRCPSAMAICTEKRPRLLEEKPGHLVECFLYGE